MSYETTFSALSSIPFSSITSLLSLITYIFGALGYYTIARRRGYDKPWLAWIPIANLFLMGLICDMINAGRGIQTKRRRSIPILSCVISVSAVFMIIGIIILAFSTFSYEFGSDFFEYTTANTYAYSSGSGIAWVIPLILFLVFCLALLVVAIIYAVFYYKTIYVIFEEYDNNNKVLYLVLSILFNIGGIFIFAIRNKPAMSEIYAANPGGWAYGQPGYNPAQSPYGQQWNAYQGQSYGQSPQPGQWQQPGQPTAPPQPGQWQQPGRPTAPPQPPQGQQPAQPTAPPPPPQQENDLPPQQTSPENGDKQ